jgi:hypothetical protein
MSDLSINQIVSKIVFTITDEWGEHPTYRNFTTKCQEEKDL